MVELFYTLPAEVAVKPTSDTFMLPITDQRQVGDLTVTTFQNGVRLEQRIVQVSATVFNVEESRYFLADGRQAAVLTAFELDIFNLADSFAGLTGVDVFMGAFDDTLDFFQFAGVEPGEPFDVAGATFDFGAGDDLMIFRGDGADVTLLERPDGNIGFTYGDSEGVLVNLETIVVGGSLIDIVDGQLSGTWFGAGLDEAEARTVAYLYEAGLDRDGNIDTPGLNFWIDRREGGLSERALAQAFLDSGEFEAAFGAPETLSDRALIEQLYRNVLDREGEEGGIAFWEAQLARPAVSRADMLLAFAESPENVAGSPQVLDLTEVAPGEWDFLA